MGPLGIVVLIFLLWNTFQLETSTSVSAHASTCSVFYSRFVSVLVSFWSYILEISLFFRNRMPQLYHVRLYPLRGSSFWHATSSTSSLFLWRCLYDYFPRGSPFWADFFMSTMGLFHLKLLLSSKLIFGFLRLLRRHLDTFQISVLNYFWLAPRSFEFWDKPKINALSFFLVTCQTLFVRSEN